MEAELAEARELIHKLSDEVQVTLVAADDRESLRRVVRDLEEQLATLSHSERLAQQKITQLEDELKNMMTLEEVCGSRLCFPQCNW